MVISLSSLCQSSGFIAANLSRFPGFFSDLNIQSKFSSLHCNFLPFEQLMPKKTKKKEKIMYCPILNPGFPNWICLFSWCMGSSQSRFSKLDVVFLYIFLKKCVCRVSLCWKECCHSPILNQGFPNWMCLFSWHMSVTLLEGELSACWHQRPVTIPAKRTCLNSFLWNTKYFHSSANPGDALVS